MIYSLYIAKSLLHQIWYFPVIIVACFIFDYLSHHFSQAKICLWIKSNQTIVLWGFAVAVFIIFTLPYWLLGQDAPHSASDDVTHTLQTYLQSSHRGNSINWTNGLMGGMDRWLLPNCHPWALGRIYALFLQPIQLYLLVMGINILSVFIFSWKIQTEILGMRRWVAYIGSTVAVIIEGYWTGIYPNAHVSNGHGFAVIIVGIYWLTRFHESPKFWLVSLLVGLALALGSWVPFHNLPPLLITVTIWGLVFWSRRAWLKIIQANLLIVFILFVVLFPQFLALKLLYATSSRSMAFRPTVDLKGFYPTPEMLVILGTLILSAILKIYRQKIVQKVLLMLLGFSAVPVVAYFLEISKIMPAFRWELLYAGNEAWIWIAVIFFMDKIQESFLSRWRWAGIFLGAMMMSIWWTIIAVAWMNSLWFDLDSSYPSGTWRTFTDSSVSSVMKELHPEPVRVVGIDDTNDMHFWGQYQGFESMIGYTPFIDQRKTYFWWYSAMLSSLHGAYDSGFLSIPIPVKDHHRHLDFPVPLPAIINPDALRLANVHWIVSHHPLYPMPGLLPIIEHPGQPMACMDQTGLLIGVNPGAFDDYWKYIGCLFKDYHYDRPLYVYDLTDALPRAYLASHVLPWPPRQIPVLTQPELSLAAKKNVFVGVQDWMPTSEQNGGDQVAFEDYQSDYMRLRISTRGDALLVVAATLNQYWHVVVDKKPENIIDVNGFQTGFWVHPDNKEAELVYCPPWRLQEHAQCQALLK